MRGSGQSTSPSRRRALAVESFQNAALTIGPIDPGMSLFAITRGQFSMIDAILHTLDCLGPSVLSIWTWTVADYEIANLTSLRRDGRITGGTLLIDGAARGKNAPLIREWQGTFGERSVRYLTNHSKIATVEGGGRRVLLRGSMNLNCNPRFEQLDVTEGGPDFDLVRRIEGECPVLADDAPNSAVWTASRLGDAFSSEQLAMFQGLKRWAK